jgi:hypothetical protein
MTKYRNYWIYSIGCFVVWGVLLAVVAAQGKSDKMHTVLLVFVGWSSGGSRRPSPGLSTHLRDAGFSQILQLPEAGKHSRPAHRDRTMPSIHLLRVHVGSAPMGQSIPPARLALSDWPTTETIVDPAGGQSCPGPASLQTARCVSLGSRSSLRFRFDRGWSICSHW